MYCGRMEGVGRTRLLMSGFGGVVTQSMAHQQTILEEQFGYGFGKAPDQGDEIKRAIAKALRSFPEAHKLRKPRGITRRILRAVFAEYDMLEMLKSY